MYSVYTVHWHCTAFEYEIKETLINKDCKDLDWMEKMY